MTDIESQLREAMIAAGLTPPSSIFIDGKLHRFRSGTKERDSDKTGWYCIFPDGTPAGKFGCWRVGLDQTFRAHLDRELTEFERAEIRERMLEIKAMREQAQAEARASTASIVATIWDTAEAADPSHPYLTRKGIQPNGARQTGDGRLVVPAYTPSGDLSTLQYIDEDGHKLWHLSGATAGCFWALGSFADCETVYLAEGFATGATIHEATGKPVALAYSASNLVPVCETLTGYGYKVVIVADHDKGGVGQRYAEQAAAKFGARYVMPPEVGDDANDYAQKGGDLLALLEPPKSDWLVDASEFWDQSEPIKWLVKGWIPQNSFAMVWGPSGVGKTFFVLDLCLRVAVGTAEWCGKKIRQGQVVYLAGEGQKGVEQRIGAWMRRHGRFGRGLIEVSKSGCDLDTNEGYLKARDSIVASGFRPSLIVVDTLHRFLSGDENSSQDAKKMITACDLLQREFGATVLLVHHTGASEEAKHRMRGSSAWKGALDVEISITPEDGEIVVSVCKMKDADAPRDVSGSLSHQEITGWFDEDGEQVSSVVFEAQPRPEPIKVEKKESAHSRHWATFERAWWASGTELDSDGLPFISRAAMLNKLRADGLSENQARTQIRADKEGMIGVLLRAGTVEWRENLTGWCVTDATRASLLAMRASSDSNG